MRRRQRGSLAAYDRVAGERMVADLSGTATGRYVLPNFDAWTDDEIAELIARDPNTRDARLGESELRNREAWRTPAKWSLWISLASIILAIIAFLRTL